jgi:hypothetical protein
MRAKRENRARLWARRAKVCCESLECRKLLTVTLDVPTWNEQGPGPIVNGATDGLPDNPVTGAINCIAIDPRNSARVFIGAVNGGIWRTDNINASPVSWTPLTDQMPSLAISSIAFSPFDNNGLFAATGNYSSDGSSGTFGPGVGGQGVGLYKSTDGGDTWRIVGSQTFGKRTIRKVVPAVRTLANGTTQNVVLVASDRGIFRSVTGGESTGGTDGFINVLQPTFPAPGMPGFVFFLPASDLIADPNPSAIGTFYAAFTALPFTGSPASDTAGMFKTTDFGDHWTPITTGIPNLATTDNIKFAAAFYPALNKTILYAGQEVGSHLADVWRSTDTGTTWKEDGTGPGLPKLDVNPGGQGNLHFSIVADPTDETVCYVGGDGTSGIFGENVAVLAAIFSTLNTFVPISSGLLSSAANGTSPHPDSRFMVFLGSKDILEADDGGIYRLRNALSNTRKWEPLNGNLRLTEFLSVALDPVRQKILGGTQDNGSPEQNATFNTSSTSDRFRWNENLFQGDGGDVDVDLVNRDPLGNLNPIRYSSNQFLQGFFRLSAGAPLLQGPTVALNIQGTSKHLDDVMGETPTFDPTLGHNNAFQANRADSNRMLIGTSYLYESTDRGDDLTVLGVSPVPATMPPGPSMPTDPIPAGFVGHVNTVAYGGHSFDSHGMLQSQPAVAYVGTDGIFGTGFLRTRFTGTGLPVVDTKYETAGGTEVLDIQLDPNDARSAWVLDAGALDSMGKRVSGSRVWLGAGIGTSGEFWINETGNLSDPNLDTLTLVNDVSNGFAVGVPVVLVGGLHGVYRMDPNENSVFWQEFGVGLPKSLVTDLRWDPVSDVLLAGTQGRGAWTIGSASTAAHKDAALKITGTSSGDAVALQRDGAQLLIALNGVLDREQYSLIKRIDIDLGGGSDALGLNLSTGEIAPPRGISFTGNTGSDNIVMVGGDDPSDPNATTVVTSDFYVATLMSSDTTSTINFADGAKLTLVAHSTESISDQIRSPEFDVFGTTGTDQITLDDGSGTGDGLARIAMSSPVNGLTFAPIDFARKQHVFLNADPISLLFGGDDTITLANGEPALDMLDLTVLGRIGKDTFNVLRAPLPTKIDGGDDGDTVNLGRSVLVGFFPNTIFAQLLDGITAAVTVAGGNGSDTLTLSATSPLVVGGFSGEITNTTVTGFGMTNGGVSYGGIATLNLNLGSTNDTVNVRSTASGCATNVDAGGGNNLVRLGSAGTGNTAGNGNVAGIKGALSVTAGTGTESLILDDTGNTAANTGVINGATITGLGMGAAVTYSGMNSLTLRMGSGSDEIDIRNTFASVSTTLNGGAGNDLFRFGSSGSGASASVSSTLAGIDGGVTVIGGSGSPNSIVFDNSAVTISLATVSSASTTGLGMGAAVSYPNGDVQRITIFCGGVSLGNVITDARTNSFPALIVNNGTIRPQFPNRMVTSPVHLGHPTTLSGVITDPNVGDNFILDVNWGDGNATQTFTFPAGTFVSGQTVASVQHTYAHVGKYQLAVSWHDQFGIGNQDNTLVVKVIGKGSGKRSGNKLLARESTPVIPFSASAVTPAISLLRHDEEEL